MNGNKKIKKQHYVAQSYLRWFTAKGDKIFVYDKFSNQVRQANVKDVAEERYFYDFPEEIITQEARDKGIHSQIVEHALASIDARFKKAINEIVTTPSNKAIRPDLKAEMSYFLTVQLFRTKDTRNHALEIQKRFLQSTRMN